MKSQCSSLCSLGAIAMISLAAWAQQAHPILATGSSAPNFELPGIDGAIHKLSDYSASRVLVVIFTCNHCPIAQMYERRIAQLTAFDPTWEAAVPYTVLISPDGQVLYKKQGSVDILELRRTILANLPSDYEGFNRYWSER